MADLLNKTFGRSEATTWAIPNYWDILALFLVVGVIFLVGWGAKDMVAGYQLGQKIPISLEPSALPYYSLRTVLRMLIGLTISLIFTLIVGLWAAKSRQAERVIIPLIDILQSVPVLGFQVIAIIPFIALFPGSMLGPECAAIFAIFTSQVWNMTLSFYQSCRSIPADLVEAVTMYRLSSWQRFWRVEVPYAMPGLIWNAMMSMSASWFFVVVSESITVANQHITLPGIGSYIAAALPKADLHAVFYAIIAMFVVILAYDQLLFRPLSVWIERFKAEESDDEVFAESWVANIFHRSRFMPKLTEQMSHMWDKFVGLSRGKAQVLKPRHEPSIFVKKFVQGVWNILFGIIILASMAFIAWYVFTKVTWHEGFKVVGLGLITAARVMILVFIASFIWVPVGVWIGLRPRLTQYVQPLIQFLASFPAYLFFPVVVMLIVTFHLNAEIWTSPLMVLGTQWYILFNVIVGTIALPKSLRQAAGSLHVSGWLWWKRVMLPGIFPYYITGAITAAGGAWNASIVAEVVTWGDTTIRATGLGSYITEHSTNLDYPRLALGIAVMCLLVVFINRIFWRPLYNMAQERFIID